MNDEQHPGNVKIEHLADQTCATAHLRVEIMKGSTEVSYDQTTGKLRQTILKENGVTEQMIKIVST